MKCISKHARTLNRLAVPLALVAASCTTIDVRSNAAPALAQEVYQTWAWAEAAAEDDEPATRFRDAIGSELSGLGLREVEPGAADLHVNFTTQVEVEVRENDPYFSTYAAEEYEVGTLVIELLDPGNGKALWRGEGASELRVSAALGGLYTAELKPTEAPRDWRVTEKVARVLGQLEVVPAKSPASSAGVRLTTQ